MQGGCGLMQDVGRLLSLISHEVRAPLGVMRGYMRLLEQQSAGLSEPHQRAVSAALKAGERAAEILDQVSTLARLQRGEVAASLAPTPLEPLLRAAVHDVKMPSEPIITIHVEPPPAVEVMADLHLLRTAIAGLTSAVVRAQAQDARVYLRGQEEGHSGLRAVRLTISSLADEGGPLEDVPLDLMRGGLGLELPIAAHVIAAHHGELMERRMAQRFAGVVLWLSVV